MGNIKCFTLVLVLILAASSLMVAESVSAQSLKPIVTEFSLKFVDNSYDVPPKYESTTDLYTGEVTTTTIPGYRVENKSIVATIKNPPDVDAYNFRWKAHGDSTWVYDPFNTDADRTSHLSTPDACGVPTYASDSEYTVISLTFIPKSVTSVDVQVQALYGDYRAVPYVHPLVIPGGPTYDFFFDGQASYWSDTQAITIGNNADAQTTTAPPTSPPTPTSEEPTPSPTAAPTNPILGNGFALDFNQIVMVVLIVLVAVLFAITVVILSAYRKLQKQLSM
jgi:hypothetical protein